MFPIVQHNENPDLSVFGFDYSKSAVDVVKVCSCAFAPPSPASTDRPFRFPTRKQSNPLYDAPPMGKVHSDVWDLSSTSIPEVVEPGSVDICLMVFVLSALQPGVEWERAMNNVWRVRLFSSSGIVLVERL